MIIKDHEVAGRADGGVQVVAQQGCKGRQAHDIPVLLQACGKARLRHSVLRATPCVWLCAESKQQAECRLLCLRAGTEVAGVQERGSGSTTVV